LFDCVYELDIHAGLHPYPNLLYIINIIIV